MSYLISQEQVNQLFNYLKDRPWVEANPLIATLQKLDPVEVQDPEPKKGKK